MSGKTNDKTSAEQVRTGAPAPEPEAAPADRPDNGRRALVLLVFLLLGMWFFRPVEYDNEMSRYLLLDAVVNHMTLNLNTTHEATADVVTHNGDYYSDKAMGAPLLALPSYLLLRKLTILRFEPPLGDLERHAVVFLNSSLLFALLGLTLYATGVAMSGLPRPALRMVLTFGLGTLAWAHAAMFSGHMAGAALTFLAFALLHRRSRRPGAAPRLAILAGLCAGLGGLSDFMALFPALILIPYGLTRPMPRRDKVYFLLALAACGLLQAAYNQACFGSPLAMPFANQDLAAPSEAGPVALFRLLASPGRGLFFISPVLLFAGPGLIQMSRRPDLRAESVLILTVVLGAILINAAYPGWDGGWAFGPRYLIAILPFLALPLAFAPGGWLFRAAFLVSLLQAGSAALGPIHIAPEVVNPLPEVIWPLLGYGYVLQSPGTWLGMPGPWSVLALAPPLALLLGLAGAISRRAPDGPATPLPFRLTLAVCLLGIVYTLWSARTPDPATPHTYACYLLRDAAPYCQSDPHFQPGLEHECSLAAPQ